MKAKPIEFYQDKFSRIIQHKSQSTPIAYPYIPVKKTDYKHQRQVKKNI